MEPFRFQQILEILGLPPQPGPAAPIAAVTTDSRAASAGSLFLAIQGQRQDGHQYVADALQNGAVAAVVSKDIALPPALAGRPLLKVADTIAAYGRIAAWRRRQWGGPVVAITGSNGKTTTREMLAHLLSPSHNLLRSPKSFNNNIGVPHTLLQLAPSHDLAIIELGTSAPGEIAPLAAIAQPDHALITNIGESHLEQLVSLEGVAREKGSLLQALPPSGHAFLNADDPMTPLLASLRPGSPLTTFGRGPGAHVRCVREERSASGSRFWLAEGRECLLPVPGRHNITNALGALAVCQRLGLLDQAIQRLATFSLPELRFNVRRYGPITVIADCYNANPRSMTAALDEMDAMTCPGRRLMVCGDMLEMGHHEERLHRELGRRLAQSTVDTLFTVGKATRWTAETASQTRPIHAAHYATVHDAAEPVTSSLRPGDTVLIKGSHSIQLENLVEAVRQRFQPVGAV